MGQAERLAGRPKICSDCGICYSAFQPRMPEICEFINNHSEAIELRLHGRNRRDGDELLFGIHQALYAARLPKPRPDAQWSGMVTTLAARLLALGLVDGVITTKAAPGTRYAALPFLARTPAEVLESAGNKPSLSSTLSVLDEVRASGVRRLAVVGVGCHVHMLREVEAELGLEKLYVIGIPCTDNVAYPDLLRFLNVVSASPETVVHHEFMQDFRIWLRHEDGHVEKINFVDLPMGKLDDVFPHSCLSCFDYANTLADITIGYMGAPLGWQWVVVRTETGRELFNLLAPELEYTELLDRGDRQRANEDFIRIMAMTDRKRTPWIIRKLIAFMQRRRGPKGLEFARSVIEMKLLRNLQHVRTNFPNHERRIVPGFVYRALARYAHVYQGTFDRSLEGAAPLPAARKPRTRMDRTAPESAGD